jgi:conjugative relaxase-like TrwC/TraI family protein
MVERAQAKAASGAMAYLERNAAYSRRGYNGCQGEDSAKIVVGSFLHTTNRLHEPQVHTHNNVFNVGLRPDGSWGALNSPHFPTDVVNAGHGAYLRLAMGRETMEG